MSSLTRILLVGFSLVVAADAAQADSPRTNSGLKYRQPKSTTELVGDLPDQNPESRPSTLRLVDKDSKSKELKDFFLDSTSENPESEEEPESESAQKEDESEEEKDEQEDSKQEKTKRLDPMTFASLPSIHSIAVGSAPSSGMLPKNHAETAFASRNTEFHGAGYQRNANYESYAQWTAPWVAYRPLYFEDPWLERHGYHHGHLQPFVSAAKFYGRLPFLAYMKGATPCDECTYSLGWGRPGDCPPHSFILPKRSERGLLYEAAFISGVALLTP